MRQASKQKRNYSAITLEEAMLLIGRETLIRWQLNASPRPPSDFLREDMRRLEVFDLETSEQAKPLLIDALFAKIVPEHSKLKIWKAAVLNTDTLTGVADYLVAPHRAYLATPLLCVTTRQSRSQVARGTRALHDARGTRALHDARGTRALHDARGTRALHSRAASARAAQMLAYCYAEAKRDDFDKGRVQCLAEMYACQWNNRQRNHEADVFGIVSNGQCWRFYKLEAGGDVYETDQYGLKGLPELLGALDHVCAECAKNILQFHAGVSVNAPCG